MNVTLKEKEKTAVEDLQTQEKAVWRNTDATNRKRRIRY